MDMVHGDQTNVVEAEVDQTSNELNNSREEDNSMNVVSEPSSEGGKCENDASESSVNKPQSLPLLLIPSLKGKMTYEGGSVTCKGMWGMSDYAHTVPGQTSEFEFKLVKADEGSSLFPVNGKYQGYFMLKQAPPLKGSVKVEDKEMVFKFTRSDEEEGQYTIHGNGLNKFGSFTLKGKLSEDGDLHVYREYYNLTPAPVHIKRRLSVDGADEAPKPKKKALSLKAEDGSTVPPPPPVEINVSPREGSGRVRKQSIAMQEYIDTTVKAPQATPKASGGSATKAEKVKDSLASKPAKAAAAPVVAAPLARQESSSDRAHRLPFPLKKAAELLKEICKHPHSIWFSEPVDHVKLNIPDYPNIISHPMDFGTIRKRLEGNLYEAIEPFAEDMRLVFRNAITFNTQRDNPVHIAARELSGRFEDRYRVLTTQIGGVNSYSAASILALESAKLPGSSSGKKNKTPRSSLGGAPVSKLARSSSGAGPRLSAGGAGGMPYLPPAVDGSSAHQLMEMQRMMQAMQNEISTLKSQVRENEIVKRLQETKDAAHHPLTFEEKKTLIAQIHKLPADKMEQVLVIIEDSLPADQRDQGEEIEVPLDALDTFTLRKLQRFIEETSEKKKRPPAAQRQSTGGGGGGGQRSSEGGAPKRPRKSSSASKLPGGGGGGSNAHLDNHNMGMHSHDDFEETFAPEDMLFAPDSFEELKAHAQRDAAQHGGHQHDDDEDFSSLVNINHGGSQDMTINNMDAWNE